ncbi:MAG: hypothetical protein QOE70_1014 [Chthoniobacter sp.]|jgi:hypothetical protein|nr:hypothetical protein [Chthoniobacter sp.]
MTIHTLTEAPGPELADALLEFERKFVYPLGAGRSFTISHGRDYALFFRAIEGRSGVSFIAAGKDGKIRGTLGVAVRPVQFPDGVRRLVAYLGDLKTAPGPGRAWTLLHLGKAVMAWSIAHGAVAAYGVVMGGTPHPPTAYTGKLGLPAFRAVDQICVLRLPAGAGDRTEDATFDSDAAAVEACYRGLGTSAFTPLGGRPELRSLSPPVALLAPQDSACGILEDTRLAKRLLLEDGREMVVAHLSHFAYANPVEGVRLVRQALVRCARRAPAMFVAVSESDRAAFTQLLGDLPGIVEAPATVYGAVLGRAGQRWNISTSEI